MLPSSDSNHSSNIKVIQLKLHTKKNTNLVYQLGVCVKKVFKKDCNLQNPSPLPIEAFSNKIKVLNLYMFPFFPIKCIRLVYFLQY